MNAFTLYPAIDMRNGKCVRLIQGDYGKETIYGDSPLDMAAQFAQEGAEWIHLVDLDGAKAGRKVNDRHVLDIARQLDVKVEIGGGIRSEADVYGYLSQGVDRVILGSSAVSDPAFVKSMLKQYGGKIAIGLDARNGYVSTEGWLETSSVRAADLAVSWRRKERKPSFSRILQLTACCQEPNIESTVQLAKATGKTVIASGGVSSVADLKALARFKDAGVSGAIIGKALYTKQFTLAEALSGVKDA
ncbi:1-(5-phosphoribosyl)-5-[(5-phosphoribosylamino)methylideneamino]imidazole-4-carboxamide isomerase [Bacillus sp. 4A_MP3]